MACLEMSEDAVPFPVCCSLASPDIIAKSVNEGLLGNEDPAGERQRCVSSAPPYAIGKIFTSTAALLLRWCIGLRLPVNVDVANIKS